MSNLTAIQRISNFIESQNIRTMKKWSERFRPSNLDDRGWYIKRLARKVKDLLVLVSGYDVINMLKGFLFCCNIKTSEVTNNFIDHRHIDY